MHICTVQFFFITFPSFILQLLLRDHKTFAGQMGYICPSANFWPPYHHYWEQPRHLNSFPLETATNSMSTMTSDLEVPLLIQTATHLTENRPNVHWRWSIHGTVSRSRLLTGSLSSTWGPSKSPALGQEFLKVVPSHVHPHFQSGSIVLLPYLSHPTTCQNLSDATQKCFSVFTENSSHNQILVLVISQSHAVS